MYGALYLNIDSLGIKNSTNTSTSVASNFTSAGNIDLASNKDFNMIGSNMASDQNITLNVSDKLNIQAGENTISQTSKLESNSLTMSMGNNGIGSAGIAHNQSESDYDKTYYTNSIINSQNGTLTLNSGSDANIAGANILTKDLALNVGGNLNLTSKQTEETFTSDGFGFNVGGGGGNGTANVSLGFNMSSSDMYNRWTDNQTILTATDSANITTTKDLNLTGAAILSDNVTLNVGGNINKTDLYDKFYSESMSLGVSTNLVAGVGKNNNVDGTPNLKYPGGSSSINLSLNESERTRTVYGMIGGLDDKTVSETKEMLGADFEGSLTLDHRLFTDAGQKQIGREVNFTLDLLRIPVQTLGANDQESGGINVLDSMANKYSVLQDLMFNPELTAKDLNQDSDHLITYNGNEIDQNSDAASAQGFYDRKNNTSAINVGENQTDAQIAGALSHENYHAQIDNQGISYSQREENTAHDIGDFGNAPQI